MALRSARSRSTHGIPILERQPLARALYKLCEVGQEIPEQFYSAVAEILAYVYELTGKAKEGAGVVRARAQIAVESTPNARPDCTATHVSD